MRISAILTPRLADQHSLRPTVFAACIALSTVTLAAIAASAAPAPEHAAAAPFKVTSDSVDTDSVTGVTTFSGHVRLSGVASDQASVEVDGREIAPGSDLAKLPELSVLKIHSSPAGGHVSRLEGAT